MCCSLEHAQQTNVAEMFPFLLLLFGIFLLFYLDVNLFIGLSAIVIIKESYKHHFGYVMLFTWECKVYTKKLQVKKAITFMYVIGLFEIYSFYTKRNTKLNWIIYVNSFYGNTHTHMQHHIHIIKRLKCI